MDVPLFQVAGYSFKQACAILRAVFARLLELDEVGADEPVAEDEVAVDGAGGAGERLAVRPGDGGDEGVVVHGIGGGVWVIRSWVRGVRGSGEQGSVHRGKEPEAEVGGVAERKRASRSGC